MPRDGRPKLTGLDDPEWLDPYFGLTLAECEELAARENRQVRVQRPGYFYTADWKAERLNVMVDEDDNVRDIFMG